MSEPLPVEITALAAQLIRNAETWWRVNRTLAPNAVRQEIEQPLRSSPVNHGSEASLRT